VFEILFESILNNTVKDNYRKLKEMAGHRVVNRDIGRTKAESQEQEDC